MARGERLLDEAARLRNRRRYRELREGKLRVFERTGVVFIHIPKTAGVSVTMGLFDADSPGGHKSAAALRRILGRRRYDELWSFTFVRDPLDRLASAYRYIRAGGRAASDARAAERIAGCGSLDEFALEWLTRPRTQTIPHFRPQSWFLTDRGGNLIVDFVGRYEQLADDYATVAGRLGRAPELPDLNRSGGGRSTPEPLSPEARAAAVEFYARDYELLDYPLP